MSINLYDTTIVPIKTLLSNLSIWLKRAEEYADSNNLPHTHFTEARLAPDMLPLPNQIIIACNAVKFLVVRVANHPDQVFEDNQKTFAEMQERIAATLKFLEGVKREEFDAPDVFTKTISVYDFKFEGGLDYLNQYAMPNFYFHVTTAYDILRHKDLPLGKKDFLAASRPLPK